MGYLVIIIIRTPHFIPALYVAEKLLAEFSLTKQLQREFVVRFDLPSASCAGGVV